MSQVFGSELSQPRPRRNFLKTALFGLPLLAKKNCADDERLDLSDYRFFLFP